MTKHSGTALVTGAATGIGRASALALAAKGFTVYASARTEEKVLPLREYGCRTVAADVTDEASLVSAVRRIESETGGVDVLVNNAGLGVLGPIEEVPLERWRTQFETNVFGVVRLTQLVLPGMRARGHGRVVIIGSAGGEHTFPFTGAYHSTKYALEAVSDALRFETRPFGIRVSLIQPAAIKTPLADQTAVSFTVDDQSPYAAAVRGFGERARTTYERGLGIGVPEDVAKAVVDAACSGSPKPRYKVTAAARILWATKRLLPDRAWDAMLRAQFKAKEA